MTYIIILAIVFVIMMLAPLLIAWVYAISSKGEILNIKQDMIKDPRYFSHSFTKMIEKALPGISGNTIKLSREEHFYKPHDIVKLSDTDIDREIDEMVLAIDEPMEFPERINTYNKEIYSSYDMAVDKSGLTLRAIYSAGRMYLANKTSIIRWADAEDTLAVYDDCDTGMAATAGHVLTVGRNVKFRRLYAPAIYFGQYPIDLVDPMEGRNELTFMLPIIHDKKKQKHVTHENMTEHGTAPYSIVTTNTMIVEDAVLQGDIHTDGSVRICEGAGVLGNIFAEKGILIEKGAFVVGNVFSQGKIEIRSNVMIGKKGQIVSVISRDKMTIAENVVIYGYVSSEKAGYSCPIYNYEEERYAGNYYFAPYEEERLYVSFDSLRDYEKADDMAFRKNMNVMEAIIPDGAHSIRRSMFWACKNLKKLAFPNTLREIDDFALMDCTELEEMSSFEDTQLERLGLSAMENCSKITSLHFPASLYELGNSACANMTELSEITFPENCRLSIIGEHVFRGCAKLASVVLPDSVEKIGISAFRDCTELKYLSVSEKVKDEPGIKELETILPELTVEFRQGEESV